MGLLMMYKTYLEKSTAKTATSEEILPIEIKNDRIKTQKTHIAR